VIKEVAVTVTSVADFYRDTEFGRKLYQEGFEEGFQEGLEEVRRERRQEFLMDLLHERFGEHPGMADAAQRLATWPTSAALHAILVAPTFDNLPTTPSA
jgi:hypothetical protein